MQLVDADVFFLILSKSGVESSGVDAASVDRAEETFIRDVINIFRHAYIPAIQLYYHRGRGKCSICEICNSDLR